VGRRFPAEVIAVSLSDRKKRILKAIINAYIDTGEPVGSKTVLSREDFSLSPATVRNEMSDLENEGYLIQPHTSAGRVPSPSGFRFYVENVLPERRLSEAERIAIRGKIEADSNRLDRLMHRIASVTAEITGCAALSFVPAIRDGRILMFETALVNGHLTAVVAVCESGVVKTAVYRSEREVTAEDAAALSRILNANLTGIPLSDIGQIRIMLIKGELTRHCPAYGGLSDVVRDMIAELLDYDVAVGGEDKVFSFADFQDIEKARRLYALLQSKEELLWLGGLIESSRQHVIIGGCEGLGQLDGISILSSPYTFGGRRALLAAVAPLRINYARMMSSLEYITSLITGYMNGESEKDGGRDK